MFRRAKPRMPRKKERVVARIGSELVAECSSYLDGTLMMCSVMSAVEMPSWMLINSFAHGDLAQLEVLSLGPNWLDATFPLPWYNATQAIAAELSSVVGGDAVLLRSIQRSVLIPLESHLMVHPVSVDQLSTVVRMACEEIRPEYDDERGHVGE